MDNYITIELKTNDEGGTGVDVLYTGKDRNLAEKKYHEALATAATSGRSCHSAVLMKGDGTLIDTYSYTRNENEGAA